MNRFLLCVSIAAGLVMLIPVIFYITTYGYELSESQAVWAQFGDFFGGILNPIYAFLAFLALLYTISLQAAEMRLATAEFRRSADSMQKQLDRGVDAAKKDDLYKIIKDVDSDMAALYEQVVSPDGFLPKLKITHVVHEGFRLRKSKVKSKSYSDFLLQASTSGTLVEAAFFQLSKAGGNLYRHLMLYQELSGKDNSVTEYYRYKHFMLGQLLKDSGKVDVSVCNFFLSAVKDE